MPVTRESINEHCGWAPTGCHSMIIREGLGRRGSWHSWVWSLSLRHYAPPSCMPTACRNFVRHQRLVVRKRRYMIWYMSIYICVCVCERNNKKRCWLLLLQTQSVLNLACLARNCYMAIHEHRCTYCLLNISGFNFKMHGKLQGLCWPCRSHSPTS